MSVSIKFVIDPRAKRAEVYCDAPSQIRGAALLNVASTSVAFAVERLEAEGCDCETCRRNKGLAAALQRALDSYEAQAPGAGHA